MSRRIRGGSCDCLTTNDVHCYCADETTGSGGELTLPTVIRKGNDHRPLVIGCLVTVHCALHGTVPIAIGFPGDLDEHEDDSYVPVGPRI